MRVDPIKSTLKATGTERLKLQYDVTLSNFAISASTCAATPSGNGQHRPLAAPRRIPVRGNVGGSGQVGEGHASDHGRAVQVDPMLFPG